MEYTKNIILKNARQCLLRNAVGEDAREVLNVFLRTREQTDFLSSYKDEAAFDEAFEQQFLRDKARAEREAFLCAVMDGHIVGTAGVEGKGGSKVRHRAEFGIAIDQNFWGLGIGRALTAACIECAKNAGYVQLELEVVSDHSRAVSLYERMGFVEFGRNPRGFCSRCKDWQELISMRLELN